MARTSERVARIAAKELRNKKTPNKFLPPIGAALRERAKDKPRIQSALSGRKKG